MWITTHAASASAHDKPRIVIAQGVLVGDVNDTNAVFVVAWIVSGHSAACSGVLVSNRHRIGNELSALTAERRAVAKIDYPFERVRQCIGSKSPRYRFSFLDVGWIG